MVEKAARKELGIFAKKLAKIWDEADTDHDGTLSPDEVYELVLKFYIKVNRQAPINPPTRDRVMLLFAQADVSQTGRLDYSEFVRLIRTMYARASSRVLVHKVIQMIFAPLMAISLIHFVQTSEQTQEWIQPVKATVSEYMPKLIMQFLLMEKLWATLCTVFFVQKLGGLALSFVDWLWWGRFAPKQDQMEKLVTKP